MPRKRTQSADTPAPEGEVSLRLKADATVRGALCRAGSVHAFTPGEAKLRLLARRYWEIA